MLAQAGLARRTIVVHHDDLRAMAVLQVHGRNLAVIHIVKCDAQITLCRRGMSADRRSETTLRKDGLHVCRAAHQHRFHARLRNGYGN